MLSKYNRKFKAIVVGLILGVFPPTYALDPAMSLKIGKAERDLSDLSSTLSDPKTQNSLKKLAKSQERGLEIKKVANECIDGREKDINKSADDLELLGPQAVTEDEEVTQKRQALNQSMLSNAQELASCRLMLLRANEMLEISAEYQQQKLASELFARQDTLLSNIKINLLHPAAIGDAAKEFIRQDSGLVQLKKNWGILLGLAILAILIVVGVKGWLKQRLDSADDESKGYLEQFQTALLSCVYRHIPALAITGVLSGYFIYELSVQPPHFIGLLVIGLFAYALVNLSLRVLLNPYPPASRLSRLSEEVAVLLERRLKLLSKLLLVGFLMYLALSIHDFPQQITSILRNVYLFLLVMNLIWAVWLLRYFDGLSKILLVRTLIIIGLLSCLSADWLGYKNLADFILIGIGGSILLWALAIFIVRIWSDLIDSLDEGRSNWQKHFRKMVGVKEGEYLPGSIWFRFTFGLIIWSAFLVGLMKIWGVPDASLLVLRGWVTEGFDVGTVKIVPVKVIVALLLFALMLSVIGWIKRRMSKSWLNRSRMDMASKESMISLTGYFGVAMAFLLALSIAGVELANLALIAGALSVGIGFGLQNIVNNFISGVILLFERPIKTGDWIMVGGTEGFVKKISIRSTQIQTFDRSDVIVPNSELIASQVTNWMFRDKIGRVVVPVGVAYGTDTELVKQILLDIAYGLDMVISKSPIIPKPLVLFRSFGDSSLDFELRCFIKNIDSRLSVTSEINFAIDKAFREAAIEIPFPQRDIHIIPASEIAPE